MRTGQPTLRCPCDEKDLEIVFSYDAPPPGEILFGTSGDYRREYRGCRVCGHFFSWYGMTVSEAYGGAYVDAAYDGGAGIRRNFDRIVALPPEKSDNHARVERICGFADRFLPDGPAGRSVLDVGAGLGVFPHAMRRRGWEVTALDPDPRNEAHYRDVVGVTPQIGDFFQISPERLGRYHAVTFNKVLEHVPDPVAMLSRARPLIREGGFVYVELPDVAAATEGPGREEFGFGHDHVFSAASIVMLVERSGFKVQAMRRIREPSTKFTIYAFAIPE